MFHYPDRIEKFLKRNYPEHVHGYRVGWLNLKHVKSFGAIHIYSRDEDTKEWELFGTVI